MVHAQISHLMGNRLPFSIQRIDIQCIKYIYTMRTILSYWLILSMVKIGVNFMCQKRNFKIETYTLLVVQQREYEYSRRLIDISETRMKRFALFWTYIGRSPVYVDWIKKGLCHGSLVLTRLECLFSFDTAKRQSLLYQNNDIRHRTFE